MPSYKCPVPGCTRVLPTRKGLMGHLQMSHGIAHPSKYLSKGEKPQLKENLPYPEGKGQPEKINQVTLEVPSLATEVQPPEEYYEDPRKTHLRVEKESLEREKRELQNRLMQYEEPPEIKHLRNEIDEIRERIYCSSEENVNARKVEKNSEMSPAFPPLPHPPPLPEPPLMDTLRLKIKMLSERELFK